jgi:hypothetical protein
MWKKKIILPVPMLLCVTLLGACNHNRKSMKNEYAEQAGEKEYAESTDREAGVDRQIEKGYNLPMDARQRAEAEEDCKEMMGLILELYRLTLKEGIWSNENNNKICIRLCGCCFYYNRCILGELCLCVKLQNNKGRHVCFTGRNL